MAQYRVEIGQELPKEVWLSVAKHLEYISTQGAAFTKAINYEGQGDVDAEDWQNDMMLAIMAVRHVAEFARDKCRIIAVPDAPGGGSRGNRRTRGGKP